MAIRNVGRRGNSVEDILLGIVILPVPEDLSGRYPTCPSTGCWEHTNKTDDEGYRTVGFTGKRYKLHRWVYEHFRGRISSGLEIDHLCRNTGCCNPDHLEPVPRGVNTLRGDTVSARNAAKTHCLRGHALDGENLYVSPAGSRYCRQCQRAKSLRLYREKRPAQPAPRNTARGSRSGQARLTEEQVISIMAKWLTGRMRRVGLAREYGVTPQCIGSILSGETWGHIFREGERVCRD